jgi:hypothetical protein
MNLYDQFRPLVLKETKIDELSELCQSLLAYVTTTEGPASDLTPIEQVQEQRTLDDATSAVKFLVRKTLEDAQQRLVFRAQQFIKADIQGWRPKMEDIELLARGRGCMFSAFR